MTIAELIAGAAPVAGPEGTAHLCRVGTILAGLDNTDRDAVLDALHGDRVTYDRLAKILDAAGHYVSGKTLAKHRRQLCRCPVG